MSATSTVSQLPARRSIRCGKCGTRFVPAEASICDCVTEHRTLCCPACHRCACSSRPLEVREYFRSAPPGVMERLNEERSLERKPELAPEDLRRPLIVIADDNFDIRNVLRKLVTGFGYGVVMVDNGEDAWTAVCEFRPEIALLDALMPKADGRVVAKRIREEPALASTRTIVMTSLFTSAAQRDEAFIEFKVDAYLAKPVSEKLLHETLRGLLPAAVAIA